MMLRVLGVLTISGLLLAPTAEAAPRSELGLRAAAKLDAVRSSLLGTPRRYPAGQSNALVSNKKLAGGGNHSVTRWYSITESGAVQRTRTATAVQRPDGSYASVEMDNHQQNVRTTTLDHTGQAGRTEESTHYAGTGRGRTPLVTTRTRTDALGKTLARDRLDHASGQRESMVFHADGSKTWTRSALTREPSGLPSEQIISTGTTPAR